jgi:DNA-binding CsgD family transcriptional regulator
MRDAALDSAMVAFRQDPTSSMVPTHRGDWGWFRIRGTTCFVLPKNPRPPMRPGDAVAGSIEIAGRPYVVVVSGGVADAPGPPPVSGLTPRELEIAMLVAAGKPNKQIARDLNLSIWTVATYLKRTFNKLRIGSRSELVARLIAFIQTDNSRSD